MYSKRVFLHILTVATAYNKDSAGKGHTSMHRTFLALAVGAGLALALNKTIAGLVNTILSPLGLTYV